MLVAIGFAVGFLAVYLVTWSLCKGLDLDPHEDAPTQAIPVVDRPPAEGHCALCGAQLRKNGATSDDVVFEIEQRIGADVSAVIHMLARPGADPVRQLYLS